MDEGTVLVLMSYSLAAFGLAVSAMQLANFRLPYGRYARAGYGCGVPGKVAWVLQESPAFAIAAHALYTGAASLVKPNFVLLLLFVIHYFQRSFIFSLLVNTSKNTPFLSFISAFTFCIYNGYLQSRALAKYTVYPSDWLYSVQFVVGVAMFFVGMAINIHSDHILRNLRRPGESGYKIPKGGVFQFVSGANYLGEIVEWAGFALAAGNLSSASFAMFTACMLGTRALQHHKYYKEKFKDYPENRTALIPIIL